MTYTTIEKNLMDLAREKNCEIEFWERIYKDKESFAQFDNANILSIKNKNKTFRLCTEGDLKGYNRETGETFYHDDILQLYPTDNELMKFVNPWQDGPVEYWRSNYFAVYEIIPDAYGNVETKCVEGFDVYDYDTVTEAVKAMLKNLF